MMMKHMAKHTFLDGLGLLNGLMVLILGAFEFDLKKG